MRFLITDLKLELGNLSGIIVHLSCGELHFNYKSGKHNLTIFWEKVYSCYFI